jgi:hypothetical protein
MSSVDQLELMRRMRAFLDRRTPPKQIAASEEAQRGEIVALVRVVMKYAPQDDLGDWWQKFEDELLKRMKSHFWPVASQVEEAAIKASDGRKSQFEIIMESKSRDWAATHRKPLPWYNNTEMTQKLLDEGIIKSLREARIGGFALTQEQNRIALSQPMTDKEFEHHCEVLSRLRNADILETRIREAKALGL